MRHSHSSPSACDRNENLGEFLDERCLLLQREHQVAVALFRRCKCCKNSAANPEVRTPLWELSSTPLRLRAILRKSSASIKAPSHSAPSHPTRIGKATGVGSEPPPHPGSMPRFAVPQTLVELATTRSEEHTSELQSRGHLVCRLLLE